MEKTTEQEIKKIVREEMKEVFNELQSDIRDIKKALLGDVEYNTKGLLERVRENADYISENRATKIAQRAEPAVRWYEDMVEIEDGCSKSKMGILNEIISGYTSIKWIVAALGISGVVSLITLIRDVIEAFS